MSDLPTHGVHSESPCCEECGSPFPRKGPKRFCSRQCAATFRSRATFTPEQFWARVNKHAGSGCWEWTGSRTLGGYGHLRRPGGTFDYAHRVAYTHERGPIPDGLVIDHLCRNRACCNPDHLEPVPHRTNVARGMAPYGIRTTCKYGHDITKPQNVYTAPKGDRRCRICMDISNRERNAREMDSRRAASMMG